MALADHVQEMMDPSTAAMIAEHERIAALYLNNSEVGERRTSLYLTIISLACAVLLGLTPFSEGQIHFIRPGVGFSAGILLIGVLTFQRLVERRMRATEYLRAINRIHRYFAQSDPSLAAYYYWPPCDDQPSFECKGAVLTGLRDLIAAINSLLTGGLMGVAALISWPSMHHALPALSGVGAAIIAWILHQEYERRCLGNAERESVQYVCFPKDREPSTP